ncbi:MAG TPA: nuclear transport factor 2 family protein [Chitinophagaceae bacterium]|nr:nuclear transport factor 2 family protein [Chitinophagaceae bacterium]
MKKIIFSNCLILFLLQSKAQNETTDMATLKELNAKFINNFVTRDSTSHSRIIHKDFVCITPDGLSIDRQNYLNWWAHGFDGYTYWDYRDEDIRIFGNTALVHAKNKFIVLRDGKEVTGMSMYTDVYVKENGQWKCVQAQITRLSPENYAGDETIVKKYDYRKE